MSLSTNNRKAPFVWVCLIALALGWIYSSNTASELLLDDEFQVVHAQTFESVGDCFTVDYNIVTVGFYIAGETSVN